MQSRQFVMHALHVSRVWTLDTVPPGTPASWVADRRSIDSRPSRSFFVVGLCMPPRDASGLPRQARAGRAEVAATWPDQAITCSTRAGDCSRVDALAADTEARALREVCV